MKWYWIALIIVVALIVGYMIGKNTGKKAPVVTTSTSVPSTTTVTNSTQTGT